MSPIHSLPQELIRHTLALAYPPGQTGSGKGLCSTSLVHSSWRAPSGSLMTEQLRFDEEDEKSLELFVKSGPTEFSSRVVEFDGCQMDQVRALVGKAREGGIEAIEVHSPTGTYPKDLFTAPGLSGEPARVTSASERLIRLWLICRVAFGVASGRVVRQTECRV